MFSYYGTKASLAKLYPKPVKDTIIEPFAGAARYSLVHYKKNIILVDSYDIVVKVWKYLINATEKDIKSLPNIKEGESVDDYKTLSSAEKYLLGFCINNASASPAKKPGKFNSIERSKKSIAENLFKVRHWKVYNKSCFSIENRDATWFIDPPYEYGGEHYRESNKKIDYNILAKWVKSRKGQVIVCENTKAKWLDFSPISKLNGMKHETTEAIWTNTYNIFQNEQQTLF